MSSLFKDLGGLVLAAACGAIVGGATGHSIEAYREARHEELKMSDNYLATEKYQMKRSTIAGGGIMGAALAMAIYIYRDKTEEKKEDEE